MSGSAYDHRVEVRRVDDPAGFLDAAAALLLEDEPRHNLMLGLAAGLRDHPTLYPEYRLWLVEDGGGAVGAALRTPPHNLALARPRAEGALEALAASIDDELPGVVGALPEAEVFAALWSRRTGASARGRVAMKIAQTVDRGMSNSSASSGPVKRSRRNAAMTATVRSLVRFATRLGAEERSARPPTRNTIRSRCLNDRAALACNFIRCPPWDWGFDNHQPPRRPG